MPAWREPTAAYGSLRLPNLAIVYLVAHYTQIEHSASSASIHYMTDTCGCAQHGGASFTFLSLASEKDDSERPWIKALSRAELAAVGVDARMAKMQIVMLSKGSLTV